ncbi:unnamed protein product [Tuber melanosporum]|jgi:hypothetical protein|uniref:(Perigord truffle) hypothetical protein n=1 Tax=Tuber melanosporum (strain Mel28) TaxID=656061 RepID=D5GLM9_TUBMM|nr:uncharacterized protein GSTUM_00010277001 [Tuber melanosporum]CAZ85422.1 unnamed protein product [Tuber melanosporum]
MFILRILGKLSPSIFPAVWFPSWSEKSFAFRYVLSSFLWKKRLAICYAALDSGTGPAPPTARYHRNNSPRSEAPLVHAHTPSPSDLVKEIEAILRPSRTAILLFAISLFRIFYFWPKLDRPYIFSVSRCFHIPPLWTRIGFTEFRSGSAGEQVVLQFCIFTRPSIPALLELARRPQMDC